jgi:hypothetical protein
MIKECQTRYAEMHATQKEWNWKVINRGQAEGHYVHVSEDFAKNRTNTWVLGTMLGSSLEFHGMIAKQHASMNHYAKVPHLLDHFVG